MSRCRQSAGDCYGMKKENFIKTVISHIADTTRRAEVLAEFNDHLQNKSAYFEELGYEKEPAAEKAAPASVPAKRGRKPKTETSAKTEKTPAKRGRAKKQ